LYDYRCEKNNLNFECSTGRVGKKKKLGPLIRWVYVFIIDSVGEFTESATCELKSKTSEDMWEGADLKEAYGIIITSVCPRSLNRFYYQSCV